MALPQPRTPAQALQELLALTPDGMASSRDPNDFLSARFLPPAAEFSLIEASMASMLPQIDPRQAPNLLPDWEQMLGPDPCLGDPGTLDTLTRGNRAFAKLTNAGTICAGYFESYALSIGETITITEFPASVCGGAVCGDTLNPPPGHCAILVTLPSTEASLAICGVSECGDSLGSFETSVMECVIRNGVPLFVEPTFSYTG